MTLFNGVVDGFEGVAMLVMFSLFALWFIHLDNETKKSIKKSKEEWANRHQSWHVQGVDLKLRWVERHNDGSVYLVLQESGGIESELKRILVGGKQRQC